MMTEDKILAGNFLFVSYSHKDEDVIKEDVKALQEKGVRVWFDINMRTGDEWEEIAEKIIAHPNCKGVLFYNSEHSLVSEAVKLEREHTQARMKIDPDFNYWAVHLVDKSIEDFNRELARTAPSIYFEALSLIMQMFKQDRLYITRTDSEQCVKKIIDDIARPKEMVDDIGDVTKICFGAFAGEEYKVPLKHESPNERFVANGREYISHNNQLYNLSPLYWTPLYSENSVVVFLCDKIIGYSQGGEYAEDFLENVVYKIAFSDKEKKMLKSKPRLLTLEDIKKTQSNIESQSEFVFRKNHWWIDSPGLLENWQKTCCNGKINQNGFIINVDKGIRPVIEITAEQVKIIKENN